MLHAPRSGPFSYLHIDKFIQVCYNILHALTVEPSFGLPGVPTTRFEKKRWEVNRQSNFWIALGLVSVILAAILWIRGYPPVPEGAPASTVSKSAPVVASPLPVEASPGVTTTMGLHIPRSRPVEVFFPTIQDPRYRKVADAPCPIVNGMIDPDRNRIMETCYVKVKDWSSELPGTASPNATIIAGHTWRAKRSWFASRKSAAFNALYDWRTNRFTLNKGDEIWVRTKASGRHWLVYKVTKTTLTNDVDVMWDHVDKPAPNTLKLIGCRQPTDYSESHTENFIVYAALDRVE